MMTTPKKVLNEIIGVTSGLIASGLCVDQNYPAVTGELSKSSSISISELGDLAVTLKNIPYRESYLVLRDNRSYNIRLIDGGLLQMFYHFQDAVIKKHRLAFFPSPDLLEYQNNPEMYEEDEMYADVVAKNVVTTPLRFDFDHDGFEPVVHPMCHLTIGQYKNCRIPVHAPLTPLTFSKFILSSFYNSALTKTNFDIDYLCERFADTIHASELEHLHLRS